MGKTSSALASLKVGKCGEEGRSVSRGRQRMMVSIYILVWLRTWAYGKGSDNILQARKVWTSVGGAIKGVRRGSKETFWEMVVTEGGSQRLPQ